MLLSELFLFSNHQWTQNLYSSIQDFSILTRKLFKKLFVWNMISSIFVTSSRHLNFVAVRNDDRVRNVSSVEKAIPLSHRSLYTHTGHYGSHGYFYYWYIDSLNADYKFNSESLVSSESSFAFNIFINIITNGLKYVFLATINTIISWLVFRWLFFRK